MAGSKPTDPIKSLRHIRNIKNMLKAQDKPLDYLYFTVAINTGLRSNDVLNLIVDDFWDEQGKPRTEFPLHTKKTGTYVNPQINLAIQEAMKFAQPAIPLHDPDARLFPITRQTVSNRIRRWCKEVGIEQGVYSAHTTRKTCAYQLWAKHGKTLEALKVVSKVLGHKHIAQTEEYLGINREMAAEWQADLNL